MKILREREFKKKEKEQEKELERVNKVKKKRILSIAA
jgi:hypothetical protein